MNVAMQVGTIAERFASVELLIGERDEYMVCVSPTHTTVIHDPRNSKGGRSSRMNVGKTFHDGTGRGSKEDQVAAHYKRHGAVLADCVRELAAMIGSATT